MLHCLSDFIQDAVPHVVAQCDLAEPVRGSGCMQGKDCGEIKLRLTYVPLSRVNPLVGQRGNFFVYPKKGRDFPRMVPKSAKSTNPYYVGKIGNDKQTGNTMYNTTVRPCLPVMPHPAVPLGVEYVRFGPARHVHAGLRQLCNLMHPGGGHSPPQSTCWPEIAPYWFACLLCTGLWQPGCSTLASSLRSLRSPHALLQNVTSLFVCRSRTGRAVVSRFMVSPMPSC